MLKSYIYTISIAGIAFSIYSDFEIKPSKAFRDFYIEHDIIDKASVYRVEICEVPEISISKKEIVCEKNRVVIYKATDGIYMRGFREHIEKQKLYAVSYGNLRKKEIRIRYRKGEQAYLENIQKVFNHIFWENILLNEGKLMLHASFVETPYGAIAFSGPSGVGKSTQGDLWVKYGKGRLINGDKVILCKEKEWKGFGSPYAGSSNCHVNDSCTVKGLFFLHQGECCELRKMNEVESFKYIYTGLTLNRWEKENVKAACDLAQQLAEQIPAYEFICTPGEESVEFLKKQLTKGEW